MTTEIQLAMIRRVRPNNIKANTEYTLVQQESLGKKFYIVRSKGLGAVFSSYDFEKALAAFRSRCNVVPL